MILMKLSIITICVSPWVQDCFSIKISTLARIAIKYLNCFYCKAKKILLMELTSLILKIILSNKLVRFKKNPC